MQLSFCGPSKYNSGMLEKLHRETQIQTEFPASHCYILRAHASGWCDEGDRVQKNNCFPCRWNLQPIKAHYTNSHAQESHKKHVYPPYFIIPGWHMGIHSIYWWYYKLFQMVNLALAERSNPQPQKLGHNNETCKVWIDFIKSRRHTSSMIVYFRFSICRIILGSL